MCGIIAIHSRPSLRPVPDGADILAGLDRAIVLGQDIAGAATAAADVDRLLRGVSGMRAMVGRFELIAGISARLDQLDAVIAEREQVLDADTLLSADAVEAESATLGRLR